LDAQLFVDFGFKNNLGFNSVHNTANKNRIVLTNISSQFVEVNEPTERIINPKRLSREVAREMKKIGISTKAQQALQLEREKFKTERKIISRQRKEELEEKKWQMKRQKLKEKHRGR